MIYSVQYILREQVTASSYTDVALEDQLEVINLFDARFRFINTTATTCSLRIQTTVAQSGIFSDTVTDYSAAIPIDTTYVHEFGTLTKNSNVATVVRYTNGDLVDRSLTGVLTGWTDIQTVLSTYVGTQV